jgi:hypothetical protein
MAGSQESRLTRIADAARKQFIGHARHAVAEIRGLVALEDEAVGAGADIGDAEPFGAADHAGQAREVEERLPAGEGHGLHAQTRDGVEDPVHDVRVEAVPGKGIVGAHAALDAASVAARGDLDHGLAGQTTPDETADGAEMAHAFLLVRPMVQAPRYRPATSP